MENIRKQSKQIEALQKALKWQSANGVKNMAGGQEKLQRLKACAEIYSADAGNRQPAKWAIDTLFNAYNGLATPDLKAVLSACPAMVLAEAITLKGLPDVVSLARAMAAEIADKQSTALAVAAAANKAAKEARHAERQARRKAEHEAKKQAQTLYANCGGLI